MNQLEQIALLDLVMKTREDSKAKEQREPTFFERLVVIKRNESDTSNNALGDSSTVDSANTP